MQNLLILLAFLLPASSPAGEELYTLQIDHWESRKAGQAARSFEGRRWDLHSLLVQGKGSLQTLHRLESRSNGPYAGHSYCLRIGPSAQLQPEQRAIYLKNFLQQLRIRQAEMLRAGAQFRVIYPSNCADRGIKIMPAWIASGSRP